jgi:hypothetical protein
MSTYWLVFDPDSTRLYQGEPMTFARFVELEKPWVGRERDVEVGSVLWMYDRPLRQVSGLAHAGMTEGKKLYVNVDQGATAKLRKNPFRPEDERHVMRSEPNWWQPGQGPDKRS